MCKHVIVMGVSGSGKTAVGQALAERLWVEFIEGDDHHPKANVEKMAAGIPLTDEDRRPWLRVLADLVKARHAAGQGTVLACSALKRQYRDSLRTTAPREESFVIHLDADVETLRSRMRERSGHFMSASLLESQLATLEPLEPDEAGVVIDATAPIETVVELAIAAARPVPGR